MTTLALTATLDVDVAAHVVAPGGFLNPAVETSPLAVDFATVSNTAVPAPQAGDAGANDLWLRIDSDQVGTLTVTWTGSFAVGLELWAGPTDGTATSVDDVSLLLAEAPVTSSPETFPVGEDQTYFLRVHPMDDADNAGTGTLAWAITARNANELQLLADPVAFDTPSWLRISVLSATPDGEIEFEIGATVIFTEDADDSGRLPEMTVPLGDIAPGTYVLIARDVTSGQEDSAEFEVLALTPVPDADPPPAEPWTAPPPDVVRWIFDTARLDMEPYVFPNNPSRMSSPHVQRVLNAEHTVAPDGQAIVFEGEPVPVDWNIEGFCFDEEHYTALEWWQRYNGRFWVVDHLGRGWACTFEALDWTVVRDPNHPFAHRYKAKFFIYDGPVTLP